MLVSQIVFVFIFIGIGDGHTGLMMWLFDIIRLGVVELLILFVWKTVRSVYARPEKKQR